MTVEIDWTDVEGGCEPPPEDADGQVRTSVTDGEREALEPDHFWKSRPLLEHIHDFARARRTGPYAVLGSVMARAICATGPMVVLPPTTGGAASLNLFVGLVGPSGQGKDAAQKTAKIAFDLGARGQDFLEAPLGSGEGLAHMFMRPTKPTKEDPHPAPTQFNSKAYVRLGEIDSFAALANRQASTLTSQLRQAAMGEELGFHYVDTTKRMIVPEHTYRLCLVAGIQPSRSAILLEDADGGTPQRFVWLPAGDPRAPRQKPIEPVPVVWDEPDWMHAPRLTENGQIFAVVELPDVAVEAMDTARWERLTMTGEALDSHALLTRAKVASGFAILDGRTRVTEDDWHLSGHIMMVSDSQRALCARALAAVAERANLGKALAEADRAVLIEEHLDAKRVQSACRTIKRRLAKAGEPGLPRAEVRRSLGSKDREVFESAVGVLVNAGDVILSEGEHGGVWIALPVARD